MPALQAGGLRRCPMLQSRDLSIRGEAQPLAIGKAMFRLYNDRAGRQVRHVGSNRVEYLVPGL